MFIVNWINVCYSSVKYKNLHHLILRYGHLQTNTKFTRLACVKRLLFFLGWHGSASPTGMSQQAYKNLIESLVSRSSLAKISYLSDISYSIKTTSIFTILGSLSKEIRERHKNRQHETTVVQVMFQRRQQQQQQQ